MNRAIVTLACALAVFGCAEPGQHSDVPVRLTDGALRRALKGHEFRFINPVADATTSYVFGCEGQFGAPDGWGGDHGSYRIDRDRYCINSDRGRAACFALHRQGETIYMQELTPDPRHLFEVISINKRAELCRR